MAANNNIHPHTAITTWSGFVYQGKVAIYCAVQLLENDHQNCVGLRLQLDSLEDFAILDSDGVAISLHQVKALKSGYFGSYASGFDSLKEKAVQKNCENAKFHVAQQITNITAADIAATYAPAQLFEYGENLWCPLDEIDEKIEIKLKSLLAKLHPDDGSKEAAEYVRKARTYLDQVIMKQVLKIHSIVHQNLMSDTEAAYTQIIEFQEFLDILQSDLNQEDIGDDYYFYIILNDFYRYHQEYCLEDETLTEEELVKISGYMNEIGGLTVQGMHQFFRNMMPQRDFKFATLSDYKDGNFTKYQIHEAFLPILQTLRQAEFKSSVFFNWQKDDKSYVPTTINDSKLRYARVCNEIIKNAKQTDLAVMFEGCHFITSEIDVVSIAAASPEFMSTPESQEIEANRINSWKTVSLISLDNAKVKINE